MMSETINDQAISRRAISLGMEELLEKEFKILDHGFVRVIDYMGNDSSIVQAARVSYGSGTKKVNEDTGLINYLLRNHHTTPFEMCEVKFHIKAPYFVARQWLRHRTANVNEYSARYSIVNDEYYVPIADNVAMQSSLNKQGREDIASDGLASEFINTLEESSKNLYKDYSQMIDSGIARELARMTLPLNYYTEFYWKIDLHNLMHFLKLRASDHAQYEIRVYAVRMLEILQLWLPATYDAFINYSFNSYNLSEKMKEVLNRHMGGESVTYETSGLSKREWNEIISKFPNLACSAQL